MRKGYSLWVRGFALLCVAICFVSCAKSWETLWQEQYDLGVRYLSEGSYEEAVIAFTAAIEIEPNQAAAFVGRGDAYAIMAEKEPDDDVAQALWDKAIADYEYAFELGDPQAEKKLEESNKILQQIQEEKNIQLLLEALYTRFANADIEGAKALMRQADYQELSASTSEDCFYYNHGDGTGVAAYPDNFYYYGQFEDGLRSGQGLWICVAFEDDNISESYTYEGAWANDLPNGEGHIVMTQYPDRIDVEPGYTVSVKIEDTGTFLNGLYHGTIYEVGYMNDGSIHVWSPITAINGIYQPVEESDDAIYTVAYDQNDGYTTLGDSGLVHAVIQGFSN